MRILHISSARTFGGGERHVADLCRGLAEKGHKVFVALRPTNEWQHRVSYLPAESIFHVSIRNSFGVLSSLRIADFVKQNEIEIVHAHVARDYIPASIACLTAKPAKFVLTRHVLFPLKPFNRFALTNLSKAIAVSDAVGKGLKKVFSPSKIVVIKNGLNVRSLSAEDAAAARESFRSFHNIPQDTVVIGALGELVELKGQRDLILAAGELAKTHPHLRFVIVGKDNTRDRGFRRDLRRLAGVLGVADKILWLDWIDDTTSFFSAIDLFVSPSHSESFGLAMLEAMGHGRPVVATATEGARELFGSDLDLVAINQPVKLAGKIDEMFSSADQMRRLGELNRDRAAKLFPVDRMVNETEQLYRTILEKN